MRRLVIPVFLIHSLFFVSCQEDENNPEVPQSIIDRALDIFTGEVVQEELGDENGVKFWEVTIENANGSIVKFYFSENAGVLRKIEGLSEPFNYEIQPENDLINLSTARTVAIGAVKNSNIRRWELEEEEDFIEKWVYTFEFEDNSDTLRVYIDAENGDVLQID